MSKVDKTQEALPIEEEMGNSEPGQNGETLFKNILLIPTYLLSKCNHWIFYKAMYLGEHC